MTNQLDCIFSQQFFEILAHTELIYENERDSQSLDSLLNAYVDCIDHFESHCQPISVYFQCKLKQVVKHIKLVGTTQFAEIQKQNMISKVMKQLQKENVAKQIKQSLQRQSKQSKEIAIMLEQQQNRLLERINKYKRKLDKTLTNTLSVCSIVSTPEHQPHSPPLLSDGQRDQDIVWILEEQNEEYNEPIPQFTTEKHQQSQVQS